jgi:hypothetical protein
VLLLQYPTAEMVPGVLVVRLDAPIYFANIQWMEDKLVEYEADALRYVGCSALEHVVGNTFGNTHWAFVWECCHLVALIFFVVVTCERAVLICTAFKPGGI